MRALLKMRTRLPFLNSINHCYEIRLVILQLGFSGGPTTPRCVQRISKTIMNSPSLYPVKTNMKQAARCWNGIPPTGSHTRPRVTTQAPKTADMCDCSASRQNYPALQLNQAHNAATHNSPHTKQPSCHEPRDGLPYIPRRHQERRQTNMGGSNTSHGGSSNTKKLPPSRPPFKILALLDS